MAYPKAMTGRRLLRPFAAAAGLSLFAISLWMLYLELGRFPTEQIIAAVTGQPLSAVTAALGFLFLSYTMSAVSEALTAGYGGLRLSPGRATAAAIIVVGIGRSAGFGLLTTTALRDRLYGRRGLSGYDLSLLHI